MKTINTKLIVGLIAALFLTACGSDSDSNNNSRYNPSNCSNCGGTIQESNIILSTNSGDSLTMSLYVQSPQYNQTYNQNTQYGNTGYNQYNNSNNVYNNGYTGNQGVPTYGNNQGYGNQAYGQNSLSSIAGTLTVRTPQCLTYDNFGRPTYKVYPGTYRIDTTQAGDHFDSYYQAQSLAYVTLRATSNINNGYNGYNQNLQQATIRYSLQRSGGYQQGNTNQGSKTATISIGTGWQACSLVFTNYSGQQQPF